MFEMTCKQFELAITWLFVYIRVSKGGGCYSPYFLGEKTSNGILLQIVQKVFQNSEVPPTFQILPKILQTTASSVYVYQMVAT